MFQAIMVVSLCNLQDRTYCYVYTEIPVHCGYSTDSL